LFKVIIWATDGSSQAEQALPYAKGLAQNHGARLIVIHVNEIAGDPVTGAYSVGDEDKVQAAIQKEVEDLDLTGLF
jgi:nucleotide-binding universal stress UspA family protein